MLHQKHHKAGDSDIDQVRQKEQKLSLRDLIGEARHCSSPKHSHHFRANGDADAADAKRWNQGDSNRHTSD